MDSPRLTVGQRASLLACCSDHPIVACACGREIMLADLFAEFGTARPTSYGCPRCGEDVADFIHAHLAACAFIAEVMSRRTRRVMSETRGQAVTPDDATGRWRPSDQRRQRASWTRLERVRRLWAESVRRAG